MSSIGQGTTARRRPSAAARLGRLMAERPILLIVLAALLVSFPVLVFGFPNGHDAKLHLIWHASFADQLWSGEIYPRWVSEAMWGLGGPVFFYYPPVGFYASGLLSALYSGDTMGRFALGAAAALALGLSGATAYLWLRTMVAARAAVLTSVLYMVIPYHLVIDLYLRSAYGEYWAFVWMPLALYFVRGLAKAPLRATVGLALSYAALIATHLPTTLLFTPVLLNYAGFLFVRLDRRFLILSVLGLGLGAVTAAAYLMPAIFYQPYIAAEMYWVDFVYAFSPEYLIQRFTDRDSADQYGTVSFELLLHLSFLLVLYLIRVSWFAGRLQNARRRGEFTFWLLTCLAIFFLVTPLSSFVWDLFDMLKRVQFAWRFHAVLCVAVLPLCAMALEAAPELDARRQRSFQISMGILAVGAVVIVAGAANHPLRFSDEEAAGRIALTSGLVELVPRDAVGELPDRYTFDASIAARYMRDWPRAVVSGGEATVTVRRWEPRRISLDVDAGEAGELVVGQLYYPGWTAVIDGVGPVAVAAGATDPRLHVDLPQGAYRLDLVLEEGYFERAGEAITEVMLALLLAAYLASFRMPPGRGGEGAGAS